MSLSAISVGMTSATTALITATFASKPFVMNVGQTLRGSKICAILPAATSTSLRMAAGANALSADHPNARETSKAYPVALNVAIHS